MDQNYPDSYTCKNPSTGKVIGNVPTTSLDDIPKIFEKARAAQKLWGDMPFEKRRQYIFKMRDYMVENAEEIARVISISTGKTLSDALNTEVFPCVLGIDWYAKKAGKSLKSGNIPISNVLFANKITYIKRVPQGVVGILSPWNYPFSIPFGEIVMGLMAGNAVLYKPADETALVGVVMEEIIAAAGLPEGLTQFIMGFAPAISTAFFENGIDKVFFTGSVRVGKLLMKQAAETLTPVSLELGGNDAMIILDDANIERAVNGVMWASFQNSGQSCAGGERIYVHESVYDEFTELLKEKVKKLRQGPDKGNFDIDIGSMTVDRQLQVVNEHVEDALSKGAKMFVQATLIDPDAPNFYPVSVLTDVDHTMKIMTEETFGPVVGLMKFKTEEEVIALANDSDLGLTSSVWTTDNGRGRALAEKLETGISTVNDHLYTHGMSEVPWLGWKNSGIGATHSRQGLEEMTKVKVINYDVMPNLPTNLWWFPVRKVKFDVFVETLQLLFGKTVDEKAGAIKRIFPRLMKDPLIMEKFVYILKRAGIKGKKTVAKGTVDKMAEKPDEIK